VKIFRQQLSKGAVLMRKTFERCLITGGRRGW
jgi:hypothetical protein